MGAFEIVIWFDNIQVILVSTLLILVVRYLSITHQTERERPNSQELRHIFPSFNNINDIESNFNVEFRSTQSIHNKFKTQTAPNTNEEADSLKQILIKAVIKSQNTQKSFPESIEDRKPSSAMILRQMGSSNPDSDTNQNSINTYD